MSDRTSSTPAIRGYICRTFVEWLSERYGPDYAPQRLHGADINDLTDLDLTAPLLGLMPNRFYAAPLVHRMLSALVSDIPVQDHDALCMAAGEYIFDKQLTGLQRAIFAVMLTPRRYTKHAHRAWRHNFTDGDLGFESGPGWHRCTYTNWACHDPLICRMMMYGKRVVYSAMGCESPRVEVEQCDPARGCVSTVRWSDSG